MKKNILRLVIKITIASIAFMLAIVVFATCMLIACDKGLSNFVMLAVILPASTILAVLVEIGYIKAINSVTTIMEED